MLDDFGYPSDGSPYRYVMVGSRYFDDDPDVETGLALVRVDAVSLRVKTDAELLGTPRRREHLELMGTHVDGQIGRAHV